MKAYIAGWISYAVRCFMDSTKRVGTVHDNHTVAGLVIVGAVIFGPIAASIIAVMFGLATLIVPASILSVIFVWLLIFDGAYRDHVHLVNRPRSGVYGEAYASIIRKPVGNRQRYDTYAPRDGQPEWFGLQPRPLRAVRFIRPKGPVVRPSDCPYQFDVPMSLRQQWDRWIHNRPSPSIIVHQFDNDRVEIEQFNYGHNQMEVELHYDQAATLPEP